MMNELKQRLKFAREQAGLTSTQVERLTGLNHATLWRAENDSDALPNVETLITLAKTYRVSLDWLTGHSGELPREFVMQIRLHCDAEDAKKLIALFESLEGNRE